MSSEISAHFNCLHYDDILHLSYTFNAGHFIVRGFVSVPILPVRIHLPSSKEGMNDLDDLISFGLSI